MLTLRSGGRIFADLTIGANVAGGGQLEANADISSARVSNSHGSGFIVTPEQAATLGLGAIAGLEQHIREYRNGRDLDAIVRAVSWSSTCSVSMRR